MSLIYKIISLSSILIFKVASLQAQVEDSPCTISQIITQKSFCSNTVDLSSSDEFVGFPEACVETGFAQWFQYEPTNSFLSLYLESNTIVQNNNLSLSVFVGDNCESTFTQVYCNSTDQNNWIHAELPYVDIGKQYLIRVGLLQDNLGDLNFCIDSYYPFKVPGKSCEEASLICDDSPKIFVPSPVNSNSTPTDVNLCSTEVSAFNEAWYKWRSDSDGSIAFTLKPFLEGNNIDFAIYQITDGVDGCDLELLRCETVSNANGNNCGIETGLATGSTNLFLSGDCENLSSSFLAPIATVKGEAYALQVISQDENAGHYLEFNSTAKIFDPVGIGFGSVLSQLGPCTYCRKYDANGAEPPVQTYTWSVDPDVTIDGGLDQKRITVITDDFGTANVQVSSETAYGCILTEVDSLCVMEILFGGTTFNLAIDSLKGIECGEIDGSYLEISMMLTCPDAIGFQYSIDGGPYSTETIYRDLSLGSHEISIRLDEGCEVSETIFIPQEVRFDGTISNIEQGNINCVKSYEFAIDLFGELSGSETVSWDFGPSAFPQTISGEGPHTIEFTGSGSNQVSATISAGTECAKEVIYELVIPTCKKEIGPELFIENIAAANCNDQNGRFEFDIEGGCEPYTYFLNDSVVAIETIENLASGLYFFKVIDVDSCVMQERVEISQEEDLSLDAGPDITVNSTGGSFEFDLQYNYPDVSISFNSNNISCLDIFACTDPVLSITDSETIVFNATNTLGCEAADTVNVTIDFDPEEILFIPNVFSPNDDGINDIFEIYIPENYLVQVEQFEVFDRWGNKVFKFEDIGTQASSISLWDGTYGNSLVPNASVFVFAGKFIITSGSIQKEVRLSRTITLMK